MVHFFRAVRVTLRLRCTDNAETPPLNAYWLLERLGLDDCNRSITIIQCFPSSHYRNSPNGSMVYPMLWFKEQSHPGLTDCLWV